MATTAISLFYRYYNISARNMLAMARYLAYHSIASVGPVCTLFLFLWANFHNASDGDAKTEDDASIRFRK